MGAFDSILGFAHRRTGRTGVIIDGPFHEFDKTQPRGPDGRYPIIETWFECVWDDTGKIGEVEASQIEHIPQHKRHITDGNRNCHCGAVEIDGVVTHRSSEELN